MEEKLKVTWINDGANFSKKLRGARNKGKRIPHFLGQEERLNINIYFGLGSS